jgi:starch-binding outer membrane protein, SusD/RagB family
MKTRILFIFALLISSVACKKDFLDRNPKGQLTYEAFFQTEEHAVQATNAVYQNFRSWEMCSFSWIGLADIISDDADKGSTPNDALYMLEIDDMTFNSTNAAFGQAWTGNYQTISRANLAIANIPNIDMDAAKKARLVGECQFLRAICYLRLVQWFGDVPLILRPLTEDEYFTQTRQSVAEVYDQIEADLLAAAEVLPLKSAYATVDLGRATQGAAQGMLAKLYLLKHDFINAEIMALNVINSTQYDLNPSYNQNFLPEGEFGVESVFEIGATSVQAAIAGPGASPYNMIQGVRGVPNLGWGFNRPSDDLVAAYEVGDPRRQGTIIYVGEVLPDGLTLVEDNTEILNERYNQKAWVPAHSGLQDNGPGNLRLLRYADVLLIAAEAMNENGKPDDALIYLNKLRARARGNNNFILLDIAENDPALLRPIIYHERRVELAMEQNRWFDLLRWGLADETMIAAGKNFVAGKHELLPIPQTEIDVSSGLLEQNAGY